MSMVSSDGPKLKSTDARMSSGASGPDCLSQTSSDDGEETDRMEDMRTMKDNLQSLLTSFRAGNRSAFQEVGALQRLENVRNMQSQLGLLHFSADSQVNYDDLQNSDDVKNAQEKNMATLLQKLDDVSHVIKQLNSPQGKDGS